MAEFVSVKLSKDDQTSVFSINLERVLFAELENNNQVRLVFDNFIYEGYQGQQKNSWIVFYDDNLKEKLKL